MTTLTREQIEDMRETLHCFEDHYDSAHISALCDLALRGLEQRGATKEICIDGSCQSALNVEARSTSQADAPHHNSAAQDTSSAEYYSLRGAYWREPYSPPQVLKGSEALPNETREPAAGGDTPTREQIGMWKRDGPGILMPECWNALCDLALRGLESSPPQTPAAVKDGQASQVQSAAGGDTK